MSAIAMSVVAAIVAGGGVSAVLVVSLRADLISSRGMRQG